ncbi:MAG: pyridoxamine 5'-phosphate oxidase family protein, partial [Actinobacteria bacterium]
MESFFSRQTIGVVCSHNSDETIHAVPVQLAYRDGAFFFGTQGESRKARNLMRN